MRIRLTLAVFALSAATAQASSSLRVGNELLTAGDSAVRVTELLGKPSYKSHRSGSPNGSRGSPHNGLHSSGGGRGHRSRSSRTADSERGEQWQYRRDNRVITVTIVDGKISDIDDRRS